MFYTLKNHFLIAMPSFKDSFFENTVVYIYEHDHNGACGIVINLPTDLSMDELLNQMKFDEFLPTRTETLPNEDVFYGGPVSSERGFVIHTPIAEYLSSSIRVSDNISVTTSKDILTTFGSISQPRKAFVALGYAGWDSNQLEDELSQNFWLTLPADETLLFDTPSHLIWETALRRLNVQPWQLTADVGSA